MERGSRGESWAIEGADLLQALSKVEPNLDARLFQQPHLGSKTYTVFTKNNDFHNTADYKRVLEFADEEPIRIIAKYGPASGTNYKEPIQNVEVIYHSQFAGKVIIEIRVSGAISDDLNNYFRSLKEWMTEKMGEVIATSKITPEGVYVDRQGVLANTKKRSVQFNIRQSRRATDPKGQPSAESVHFLLSR